jgi:GNAT superfamily N-acetyltransferase
MRLVELDDRKMLEEWLRRDSAVHLYELGDLDDFFWPHTQWYGITDGSETRAVALRYGATDLPVLVLLGRERDREASRALLTALLPRLPDRFYAHLLPGLADVLAPAFSVEGHGTHERMVLVDRARLDAVDTSTACALGTGDREELVALYGAAYPGNWFDARMLETGTYFGVRDERVLVGVAGVHVVSKRYRVAALGNIATHPSARGRGFGRLVSAAVCQGLSGIDPIGLNVEASNVPAIRVYRSLGFETVVSYEEVLATRRSRSATS